MRIFGWTVGGHDSSYAILEDGVIVIHEELERLNRIKETNEDVVDYYIKNIWNSDEQSFFYSDHFDRFTAFPHGNHLFYSRKFLEELCGKDVDTKVTINEKLNNKYSELNHHTSHAANAFYASPFDNALIFSIDGGGYEDLNSGLTEDSPISHGRYPVTFAVFWGVDNKIYPIMHLTHPNLNIGAVWSGYTKGMGYSESGPPFGNQSGTIMGMAAYGDANNIKHIPMFSERLSEMSDQEKFDVAARLQEWTEETVKDLMTSFVKGLKVKNVCLTGGVALNCVMTGKIQEWFNLDAVFIPPVPYDAGLAMGTAQYYYHHILNNPRSNHISYRSPYLGRQYDEDRIKQALELNASHISYTVVDDEMVCNLLNNQKIISLFGGRSESGRRALGNRSIVADPRSINMKDTINEKTKHRSWFRPLAPSILKEHTADWFVKDIDSPYMSFAIKFKEEKKSLVPAVVHKDGTGRLQTVTEELNPRFHKLLSEWYKVSGVPILINTSFNDKEPIVETPEDALNCFLKTEIDYLYFTDYNILVKKI